MANRIWIVGVLARSNVPEGVKLDHITKLVMSEHEDEAVGYSLRAAKEAYPDANFTFVTTDATDWCVDAAAVLSGTDSPTNDPAPMAEDSIEKAAAHHMREALERVASWLVNVPLGTPGSALLMSDVLAAIARDPEGPPIRWDARRDARLREQAHKMSGAY